MDDKRAVPPGRLRRSLQNRTSDLPRAFWWLWLGTLVNRAGTFIEPFFVLYLTGPRHVSVQTAGLVLTVWGFGGLLSQPVGGYFTDRFGRRSTLAASLSVTAGTLFALSFARPLWLITVLVLLLGTVADMYRPASSAARGRPRRRTRPHPRLRAAVLGGEPRLLGGIGRSGRAVAPRLRHPVQPRCADDARLRVVGPAVRAGNAAAQRGAAGAAARSAPAVPHRPPAARSDAHRARVCHAVPAGRGVAAVGGAPCGAVGVRLRLCDRYQRRTDRDRAAAHPAAHRPVAATRDAAARACGGRRGTRGHRVVPPAVAVRGHGSPAARWFGCLAIGLVAAAGQYWLLGALDRRLPARNPGAGGIAAAAAGSR